MKRHVLLFAAASFAAPACAQAAPEERSISVSAAGVRLEDPGSIAELRVRIARAVSKVCESDGRSVRDHLASHQCRAEAMEGSERQLAQLLDRTRLAAVAMPIMN